MFKKFLLVAMMMIASEAAAQDVARWYAQGDVMAVYLEDETFPTPILGGTTVGYDYGYGYSVMLGYELGNGIRFDVEYSFRDNDVDDAVIRGNYQSSAFMFNGYYDFKNNEIWTPYIGAGAGVTELKSFELTDDVFAFQFMTGVDIALNDNLSTVLGYKYFRANDPKYDLVSVARNPYESHNITLGMKLRFN